MGHHIDTFLAQIGNRNDEKQVQLQHRFTYLQHMPILH